MANEMDGLELSKIEKERDLFKQQFLKMRTNYEIKIRELSILKELGNTLRSSTLYARNALLTEQLALVRRGVGLETAVILLVNDHFFFEAVAFAEEENRLGLPRTFSVNEHDNGPGQAFTRKMPVIVLAEGAGLPLLYLPILYDEKALGVIGFALPAGEAFSNNQIHFLALVADHIATTVVVSRFYRRMLQEENRRALLSRFFSKTVTEKILSGQTLRLGGERRTVSILFADVRGFTSLSEQLEEERVVEILNAYFSRVTPIIFDQDGTLDKYMGDGILAIFGAPIPHEDDPARALRTAVGIIRSLADFNREGAARGWPWLRVSIGINTGEAVAGYIGAEDHLSYTVIGDVVNVAQRIEAIAEPDAILIGQPVVDALGDALATIDGVTGLSPLSEVRLKGKEKPIAVYRVQLRDTSP